MRKIYVEENSSIKYWSEEIVFSDYGVFDLEVEKSTFYFVDGTIDTAYTGNVYRKGKWIACTRSVYNLQDLLKTFRTLFC